ncbi:MAG TPA: type II toxin-antitoxin system VapC family toxin [Acidobacteriaceae bacterium]|nr:type II toxin-antitoxin system VapC family toxin [Acidobacteriaceae bacterium]
MILLDTQAVLWLAQVPELLSENAREAISQARRRSGVAIADKTLWEIAMLISRKRVGIKTSLRDFLQEVEHYCTVLPITGEIAERAVQFTDRYPKDPTDRIIGATAIVHGLSLVTGDTLIRASGEVECIW